MKPHAFTLVELLVVVAIIVVLLALLIPALDKAVYQAELATCSANLKAVGSSVTLYTVDYKRYYPHRAGVPLGGWPVNKIAGGGVDERIPLKGYVSLNKHFVDPLCDPIEVEGESASVTAIEIPYALWYSFKWPTGRAMNKMGDTLSFVRAGVTETYRTLASDLDFIHVAGNEVWGAHPDADGVMHSNAKQAEPQGVDKYTYTRWESRGVRSDRGMVDSNACFTDGSVLRIPKVPWYEYDPGMGGEERLSRVPWFSGTEETVNHWAYIAQ